MFLVINMHSSCPIIKDIKNFEKSKDLMNQKEIPYLKQIDEDPPLSMIWYFKKSPLCPISHWLIITPLKPERVNRSFILSPKPLSSP